MFCMNEFKSVTTNVTGNLLRRSLTSSPLAKWSLASWDSRALRSLLHHNHTNNVLVGICLSLLEMTNIICVFTCKQVLQTVDMQLYKENTNKYMEKGVLLLCIKNEIEEGNSRTYIVILILPWYTFWPK